MRIWSIILLPLLFLLSQTGCKKSPNPDPQKEFTKQWKLNDDENQYLTIAQDREGNKYFTTNLPEMRGDSGNWELKPDSTLILYFIDDTAPVSVDSATVMQGEVSLFSGGEQIGSLNEVGILKYKFRQQLKVTRLEGLNMSVQMDSKVMEFSFEPKKISEGFNLESILRGLMGIAFLIALGFLFSKNRRAINWSLVAKGIAAQIIFALLILKVPFVESIFEVVSSFFVEIIRFTDQGVQFLFRSFITGQVEYPLVTFVITVLPTIIFFSALTSLFYYWGILQRIVYVFAWVMKRTMRLSGAESMAAAGNIFLGQTEAPLLIKPYLLGMTKSEIMTLMVGGMATIAGGVLASYIGFLGGDDPEQQLYFAKHLLAASVMSAPAAIVAAKMLLPETENFNKELKIPKDKLGSNTLEAIANGTSEGLKLAANVGAMLLVFIALMAMGNYVLQDIIGEHTGLNSIIAENTSYSGLSFQFLLGYLLSPVAWMLGVPAEDMFLVGQLLGEKTILNEFVAYTSLGEMKMNSEFMHDKSVLIATYALCGFANFASIGIQIGGIGSLVPSRKGVLSELGVLALIGGTLACFFTAAIVGMLY
jgi:CNT family concentrative nucleoside transporter